MTEETMKKELNVTEVLDRVKALDNYDKAMIESIILEIAQKRWVIRRTIDMAACDRDVEKSMQIVVALIVIGGETYLDASYKAKMSKSSVNRYITRFFELPAVKKIFNQAVIDSKSNLRGLIA